MGLERNATMRHTVEVLLDDQGRLVLPEQVQRQLGLGPVMILVVEQAGDRPS